MPSYCKRTSLAKGELRRLTATVGEGDWNLTTGITTALQRTRGGGQGRRSVVPEEIFDDTDSSDEEERLNEQENEAPMAVEEEEEQPAKKKKPANHRVVLEVSQIDNVIGQLACRDCGEAVKVTLRNVCLATSIGIECMNDECGFLYHPQPPAGTTIHLARGDNFERSTDYAMNVLYVLGFISMGDGCTEAARLLGLLGLPNDTTMKSRSFTIIESRIGPIIRQLCDDIIMDNLMEEVKLSMEASETHDEHDYKVWKDSLTDKSIKLSIAKMPKIDGSYDMAWQQKGSGNQYNSQSGHGSLVGRRTRKVIALMVKSKLCNACTSWEKKHPDIPILEHECWKNHDGSSGAMESAGILELVVNCFERYQVVVQLLCCDDDSSIRADCQWSNKDYLTNNKTDKLPLVPKKQGCHKGDLQERPDKGKLPAHVPEPRFVADPNHRRKGLTGEFIKLDKSKVQIKMTMTRMDSMRIGKNFGYMARTLKDRPQSEFCTAAKAVLDHHFDMHDYCGLWCPRRVETAEQRSSSKKYYRCKEKDAKLYALLAATMARFVTIDKLEEMAHDMDTNMNEGFNNICTWFAPKNKVFAGSGSLNNRIALAVGINSIGVLPFYKKLFRKMGITMTDNVEHYLNFREDARMKQIATGRTTNAKKEKNKNKYLKLQEQTRIAKIEFHKRAGTYRKGMNVDDPFGELLNGQAVNDERKPAAAPRKRKKEVAFCEYCGKLGHLTKRSKNCTATLDSTKRFRRNDGSCLTVAPAANAPVAVLQQEALERILLNDAAQDTARFDELPWNHELTPDDDSMADSGIFHDAMGWESDGDDSVEVVRGVL
jgi:hypothetical protein